MYRALLVVCLALGLVVACNSAPPPQPKLENLGTSQQKLLALGEACNQDAQCENPNGSGIGNGFCVDTVCCNTACGATAAFPRGERDDQVCSNVYDPNGVGSRAIAGIPDGTCSTLAIADPCGSLEGLNPCTWRGSDVNGGHQCPAPGNGTPNMACYTCVTGNNSTCPPGLPVCVNNGCTTCTGNYNGTTNGTTCPDIDFPLCIAGGCIQCTETDPGRCPALNKTCNPATNTCVGCDGDNGLPTTPFECPSTQPVCVNPGLNGACKECTAAKPGYCATVNKICDTVAEKCVDCRTSADCNQTGPNPVCNVATNTCVPCANDGQCSTAARPACDNGSCFPCDDANAGACTGTSKPICSNHTCVECTLPVQCPLAKPFCIGNTCTSVCTLDSQCPAATPKCVSGTCRECLDDAQCGGAKPPFCVGSACVACKTSADCGGNTPVCSSAGSCVACNGNNDDNTSARCPNPLLPACKSTGACVECTNAEQVRCTGVNDVCNTTTDKCVECTAGDSTACVGAKPVCNLGNGTCVACNGDNGNLVASASCPTTQLPACVPGNCFQCSATNITRCTTLTAQGGDVPVCNVTTHQCVQCTSNAQCVGRPEGICDLNTNLCTAGCADDSNCLATPQTPKCKTAAVPPRCVECLVDANCTNPLAPTCDPNTNQCVKCLTDAACSGNTPSCVAGSCVPCDGNRGQATPAACKTIPLPACIKTAGPDRGKCAECSDDDLRLCGGAKPACNPTSHTCVQCGSNAQCAGNTPICNAAGTCVACTADFSAGGATTSCPSSAKPACITAAGAKQGSCQECLDPNVSACTTAEPVCDNVANECVQCVTNAQCTGPNGVCNTTTKKCTLGCTSDANCSADAPACKLPEQFCVECTATNKTKCVGDKPNCDLSVNLCVGCTKGSECPGEKPVCDPVTKMCTTTCTLSAQCPGDRPVCDPVTKKCVDCVTNADCMPPTPICNTTTNMCGTDCSKSSECPGDAPICNPATKKCVDCTTNADCPPANPICNTTTNMCGTECSKNSECPGSVPICNPKTKNCVECIDDSMCPVERSKCDGTTFKCVTEEDATSVEGGGCSCSTVPSRTTQTIPVLVGLGLAVTAFARRRRNRDARARG